MVLLIAKANTEGLVSPEPSLFAHMKHGSRRKVQPKIRHLAPMDGHACAFEEKCTEDEKCHNLMRWLNCGLCSNFNPHLPSGPIHSYQLDESISNFRGYLVYFFIFYLIFNRNSCKQTVCVDPDQMPHSAASDLGLHCLPMSQKWDTRLIWFKQKYEK